jgi:hypothetical protein
MHIHSTRHAPIVWIAVPYGVEVLGSSADGISARDHASNGYTGWFWNVPDGGFDFELKAAHPGAMRITLIDQSWGLPAEAMNSIRPRPDDVMPAPFMLFDTATLVRKAFIVAMGAGSSQARADR